MIGQGLWKVWFTAVALGAGGGSTLPGVVPPTTSGAIALLNLDQQIGRQRDEPGSEELLLLRARFLADDAALDQAVASTERRHRTPDELLRRARVRAAVHRFADALVDLESAGRAGASEERLLTLRASILVATGRAGEVVPQLEAGVARHPGFASRSALAGAYAAIGRFVEADQMYVSALESLDTTSPFPHAWVHFARGLMWAEQAGDPDRAETLYRRALNHLPQFAAASLHLAELEASHGAVASAMTRLERLVESTEDPEALALLGELHLRNSDPVRGRVEISRARRRFESLLGRHPAAYADHAAEFYLGTGADPERAWALARQNLAARQTERALALAVRAARASGHHREASLLLARATPGT
jgi:tetratricopeptide (TPR) repeat protein